MKLSLKPGQAGGIAIFEQRGPDYMRALNSRRKTFSGGRPRLADYTSRTQPVAASDISRLNSASSARKKFKKGDMPATATKTLLAEWSPIQARIMGVDLI